MIDIADDPVNLPNKHPPWTKAHQQKQKKNVNSSNWLNVRSCWTDLIKINCFVTIFLNSRIWHKMPDSYVPFFGIRNGKWKALFQSDWSWMYVNFMKWTFSICSDIVQYSSSRIFKNVQRCTFNERRSSHSTHSTLHWDIE